MSANPVASAKAARSEERAAGARVGELFEAHGRTVFALSRMLLRGREDAEDATQQTFLLAYRSLLAGTLVEQPAGWLATIARNECYRRLGRSAPETVALDDDAATGDDLATILDRQAEIEALSVALAELPASQREAIVLREFYGLSYREVADALGVSGPAVESLIFKSRRRLQEILRPIRSAAGALVFPWALRDALASEIPGFLGGSAGASGAMAGGAVIAKIGAAPAAAKISAVVLALGAGSAITAGVRDQPASRQAVVAARLEAIPHSDPAPVPERREVPPEPIVVATPPAKAEAVVARTPEHDDGERQHAQRRESRDKDRQELENAVEQHEDGTVGHDGERSGIRARTTAIALSKEQAQPQLHRRGGDAEDGHDVESDDDLFEREDESERETGGS